MNESSLKDNFNDNVIACKEKKTFFCSFIRDSNRKINYILYHFPFKVIE